MINLENDPQNSGVYSLIIPLHVYVSYIPALFIIVNTNGNSGKRHEAQCSVDWYSKLLGL